MKKGKEWFINELLDHETGDYGNYYNSGYEDGLAYALKLAHQLDEPDKVIIPQFVADWWDGDSVTMYGGERINKKYKFRLISEFHDRGLGDYLSKVEDWLDENDSAFLDLVNGKPYEVEKEKLYYIKFSENQYAQRSDGNKIDLMFVNHEAFAGLFTEQEIKKMNPNLMALAVEVAE